MKRRLWGGAKEGSEEVSAKNLCCLKKKGQETGDACRSAERRKPTTIYTHIHKIRHHLLRWPVQARSPRDCRIPCFSSSTLTATIFVVFEAGSRGRRAGQLKGESRLRYTHPQDQGSLAALAGAGALVPRLSDPLLLHLDLDMDAHALSLRDLVPARLITRDQRCPAA